MSCPIPFALRSLTVHGHTLSSVLELPAAHQPRTLDVFEVWSGVGSIATAAREAGCTARAFDKDRIPGDTDDSLSACSEEIRRHHSTITSYPQGICQLVLL